MIASSIMKYLNRSSSSSLGLAAASAQTTTWTAATNPHVVSGTYIVPVGQTLIMEAWCGRERSGRTAPCRWRASSSATAPPAIASRLTARATSPPLLDVAGTSDLSFHGCARAKSVPNTNGVLLFADCNFSGNGTVFNGQVLQQATRGRLIRNSIAAPFQGNGANQSASLYVAYCTVVLREHELHQRFLLQCLSSLSLPR